MPLCAALYLDRSSSFKRRYLSSSVLFLPQPVLSAFLGLWLLLLRHSVEQLSGPLFHLPYIGLEIMLPKPLKSSIEIFQRVFNTQVFAGIWASQVVDLSTLSSCNDLFLRSWTSDLIVGAESCFDRLRAVGRWCVQDIGGQGRVYFSERVGQDQSIFEGLAGAGALVGAACVGDVAEEAD